MATASLSALSSAAAAAGKRFVLSSPSLSFASRRIAAPARLRAAAVPGARRFAASAASASTVVATIAVGDKLPDATLSYFDPADGELKTVTVGELTAGKKLTRALGVEMDLSDKPMGLGVRSRRYALLADDGVVKVLNLEEGGAFTTSSAEEMLKAL
uniref:Peroxiredoxin-2E-2, chloroplastic n=1 Tax=Aegilops tauschii TaxID=37682 RepID=M8D6K4_AEGTA